ncbi:NUDIX hydrolase [Algivirga pacifica]|uniref:GDP-mannose pyrophosphatase n=1 Tax=Algivirga pacifica TaxID=1162670 RepID=A0ABP9DF20_9BACT
MKKVEIIRKTRVLDLFLKVDQYLLRHEKKDGSMSETLDRLTVERGDSCTALIYHTEKQAYLMTKQFRHATYEKGPGWLLELVAGSIPEGEDPEHIMRMEIEEEAGFEITEMEKLYTFYGSPGGLSERMHLYYVEVSEAHKVSDGGGKIEEGEDIEVLYYTLEELKNMLKNGEIEDAKTIIGIQHALLSCS